MSELTTAVPDGDLVPLQPPEAVHVVTLALDHESVEEPPESTVAGDALRVTLGTGEAVTVTVADAFAEPPVPLHESMYAEFAVRAPVVCVPEVDLLPDHDPLALHDVALVLDQVSVDAPPEATLEGDALSVTVGAVPLAMLTVTLRVTAQ